MIDIESIRIYCKLRNTNVKQMERDLGIGNGVIAKWAQRGTDPPHERLVQIARYLDCYVSDITFGEKEPEEIEGLSPSEKSLLTAFRALTPEQQKFVLWQLHDPS